MFCFAIHPILNVTSV